MTTDIEPELAALRSQLSGLRQMLDAWPSIKPSSFAEEITIALKAYIYATKVLTDDGRFIIDPNGVPVAVHVAEAIRALEIIRDCKEPI